MSVARFKLSFGASDMEVQSHGRDHNNGMWSGSTDIQKVLFPVSMASRKIKKRAPRDKKTQTVWPWKRATREGQDLGKHAR